ncbi:hypothetical protein [Leptolyngbya ohadii]|uniref:hypothetical protein n=1 Tax=Leptolyngbya ohadii TaxID=1962290 RepID=UPI000B5A0F06|nr:hypothetical protein [Leptolyngbya ohadii]
MKLRSTFAAIAATTALTGAVLLTEAAHAKPCIFSQGGITENSAPESPVVDPTSQVNGSDFNKLGIMGAGFAVLGGLFAGGMMLKRKFDRKAEPLTEQEIPTADQTEQLPESLYVPSSFAIEVPKEALRSSQAVEEAELTSVR